MKKATLLNTRIIFQNTFKWHSELVIINVKLIVFKGFAAQWLIEKFRLIMTIQYNYIKYYVH